MPAYRFLGIDIGDHLLVHGNQIISCPLFEEPQRGPHGGFGSGKNLIHKTGTCQPQDSGQMLL
jgi:hypothetical protein